MWESLAGCVGRAARSTIGVPLTHASATGSSTDGVWRFDAAYRPAGAKGATELADTRPTVWLWLADLATPPEQGDEIVRGSETFRIEAIEPDGEGMARCYLSAVAS